MNENTLDKIASIFPNRLSVELDLNPYMTEEVKHRVKPANEYQDELITLLIGEDLSQKGTPLPWNALTGKFEFRQHELTLWAGYKGHGKSALLSQALNACMIRGESVFIISPEFRPAKVLERLLYQRLKTRAPDREELLEWMGWIKKLLWLYDVQASLKPNDVIALCRYAAKELGVKHILIDSLMKCGMAPDDYAAQKNFIDKVQNVAHTHPLHIHLVAHARKATNDETPPKLHDVKGASDLVDMAENVLCVWRNKPKEKERSVGMSNKLQDEPDALLIVEAQRNSEGWIGTTPLYYDPETMLFYERGNKPERSEYVKF